MKKSVLWTSVVATGWVVICTSGAMGQLVPHMGTCGCASCARAGSGAADNRGGDGGEGVVTSSEFRLGGRWTSTSASGSTPNQGQAITLRWGFATDGSAIPGGQVNNESTDPSNLVAYMDSLFGVGPGGADLTQRPWFTFYSSSFARWSSIAGLTYIYEPNDDGSTMYTPLGGGGVIPGAGGVAGVRADVRIGGHRLDGAFGVLAYNFFPTSGEMVIDTSETTFYTQSANNFRAIRNVIMHEHGHGLGMFHVISNNSRQLMEPFIDTNFDGPQFDDILGAQRHYGDAFEKGAGNDTAATASTLGSVVLGGTLAVGTSTNTTVVAATATDFVSIDDESDVDFWRVSMLDAGALTVTLTPRGPTYSEGPQFGTEATVTTSAFSDLTLELIAPDLTTTLSSVNATGLGGVETLTFGVLMGGDYFIRVGGTTTDRIQMYLLQATLNSNVIPEPGVALMLGVMSPLLLGRTRRRV